jgi:CelD/BcsL family acetyltransferase involved in cellulose biosynthesis
MTASTEISQALNTRVLRTVAEIRQITSDWRDLFHRSRATPFQNPDWLLPWIEMFSPHRLMMVEVRWSGRLVGLAPFLIYSRASERILGFMGGGVSDYLDLLVEGGFESLVISEVLGTAISVEQDWTVLDLTDLPSHSSLLTTSLLRSHSRQHDTCSVLRLPPSDSDLLHLFSNRQRANLRNASSRLQHAGGGSVQIATAESISEFLDDLFTLHTSRWSGLGQSGVLADDRVRKFHQSCAPRFEQNGVLHFARLRVANRTAAVIYSLLSGDTVYCYLQGFDPRFSRLSPGTQLMFSVIRDTLCRGMRNFDFLRGKETYKQHWRATSRPTFRIQLSRAALADVCAGKPVPVLANHLL